MKANVNSLFTIKVRKKTTVSGQLQNTIEKS